MRLPSIPHFLICIHVALVATASAGITVVAITYETSPGGNGTYGQIYGPSISNTTNFQIESDPWNPWGMTVIRLAWKSSYQASGFNIRSSDDLSIPPSSWPIIAGPIPREEPVTSFETYLPPFFLPPKLFFVVEELK